MSLRPLIKLSGQPKEVFLPSPSVFTTAEVAKMKKYLPKFLIFAGVDVNDVTSNEKVQLQREKVKIKAERGKDIVTDSEVRFYGAGDLRMKIWKDVVVFLNIPFNNRLDTEDQKSQLQSRLEDYIENHLLFTDQFGRLVERKEELPLDHIGLFFNPMQLTSQTFDNSYRQIRFILSLGLILTKQKSYCLMDIFTAIKADILNSLRIMVKNKLSVRVLKGIMNEGRSLILQSFVGKIEEVEGEELKLSELLGKGESESKKQQLIQSEKQISKTGDQTIPRKELTNQQLMLILLGLFFIYLFLKITPLEKILSETL